MDRDSVNAEVYGPGALKEQEPKPKEEVSPEVTDDPSKNQDSDKDMRQRILDSLEKVRPFLNMEGGDVEFVEFDEQSKLVKVRLQGACSHCAISSVTLKMGIEQTLVEDIPEIKGVVQVE